LRSAVFVIAVLAGCGHDLSQPAASQRPPPAYTALLGAVGPHPRGFAVLAPRDPAFAARWADLEARLLKLLGKAPADCGGVLGRVEQIRVAVGAPLRIAAELDGKIDAQAVDCLLGGGGTALARPGVVVRNRPGGVAIEYHADPVHDDHALAVANELTRDCTVASCAAVVLGPPNHPLWIQLALHDKFRLELRGSNVAHAAAVVAAVDGLRPTFPGLSLLTVREQHGALIVEFPRDPPMPSVIAAAMTVRSQLLEAFAIPSASMVPTLRVDDQIYVVKGPLLGDLVPGDLLVYRQDGRDWVKRYLAGPGQTIAVTESGVSIDGKPLATEVVGVHDQDPAGDAPQVDSSRVVREHLGARSYLTLRADPPTGTGTWTVPAGQVFLVGDNRNNSYDSRYLGAVPKDAIIGRVLGAWLAFRDGAPDWDRMGVPVE